MAADIRKSIEITMKAQTGPLEKSLAKIPEVTDKQAKKMVSELDKSFKKVEKSADKTAKKSKKSFQEMAKGVGAVGMALGAVGGALFAFGKALGDSTNQLIDASTKTGIAVDNLAGLRLAAEGSGLAFEQLEAGLVKLPLQMASAAKGTGAISEAFASLKVDVKNADGSLRDANDVFEESISGLAQIENDAERSAMALQLFGKSGSALVQSGAIQGMEAFNELTREYGIATGPKAAQEAGNMQRAMAELEMVAMGAGQQLLSAFGGGSGGVTLSSIISDVSKGIVYFSTIVEDVGEIVSAEFQAMFSPLMAIQLLMEGKTTRAAEVLKEAFTNVGKEVMDLGTTFDRAAENAQKFEALSVKARAGAGAGGGGSTRQLSTSQAITKEAEKQVDLEKLRASLLGMQQKSLSDTLSDEEKLAEEFFAQLEALEEIATQAQGLIDTETTRVEIEGRYQRELHALKMEQQNEIDEAKEAAHREELDRIEEERAQRMDAIRATASQLDSSAFDIMGARSQIMKNELEMMDRENEAAVASIDAAQEAGIISAEMAAQKKAALEAQHAEKVKEQQMKIFNAEKMAAIARITIDTAMAAARAFADYPFPFSAVIAGLATAGAAAQLAAVQSTPPPQFHTGGMVGNNDVMAPDERRATLLTGEAVLSRSTVNKIGGEAGVRALKNGPQSDRVIVVSPFKHFDKFVASSMRRPSRLRGLVASPRGRRV